MAGWQGWLHVIGLPNFCRKWPLYVSPVKEACDAKAPPCVAEYRKSNHCFACPPGELSWLEILCLEGVVRGRRPWLPTAVIHERGRTASRINLAAT